MTGHYSHAQLPHMSSAGICLTGNDIAPANHVAIFDCDKLRKIMLYVIGDKTPDALQRRCNQKGEIFPFATNQVQYFTERSNVAFLNWPDAHHLIARGYAGETLGQAGLFIEPVGREDFTIISWIGHAS